MDTNKQYKFPQRTDINQRSKTAKSMEGQIKDTKDPTSLSP